MRGCAVLGGQEGVQSMSGGLVVFGVRDVEPEVAQPGSSHTHEGRGGGFAPSAQVLKSLVHEVGTR